MNLHNNPVTQVCGSIQCSVLINLQCSSKLQNGKSLNPLKRENICERSLILFITMELGKRPRTVGVIISGNIYRRPQQWLDLTQSWDSEEHRAWSQVLKAQFLTY